MLKGQPRHWSWRGWVFQQDDDPERTSKSTTKYLQEGQMKVLEWPPQSPDLNIIENLWRDLKHAEHRKKYISNLEVFCQEELEKILKAVIAARGGVTKYKTDRVPELWHREFFLFYPFATVKNLKKK